MIKYIFYFLLLFNFSCQKKNNNTNKCYQLSKKFLSDVNVEQNEMYNIRYYNNNLYCKSSIIINEKLFVLNCDVNYNNCHIYKKE